MNTPSHVAASLIIWRKTSSLLALATLVLGALLPDIPIFLFYFYQRFYLGIPETEIWTTLYFRENWQLFFDIFNSIPLTIGLIAIGHFANKRFIFLFGTSMLLHLLCDLVVHNDDAHRHFLPFTNWQFISPVSYWDPKHHGIIFSVLEFSFTAMSSLYLAIKSHSKPMRIIAVFTLLSYLTGISIALIIWSAH